MKGISDNSKVKSRTKNVTAYLLREIAFSVESHVPNEQRLTVYTHFKFLILVFFSLQRNEGKEFHAPL
jgi:hypothetical protein